MGATSGRARQRTRLFSRASFLASDRSASVRGLGHGCAGVQAPLLSHRARVRAILPDLLAARDVGDHNLRTLSADPGGVAPQGRERKTQAMSSLSHRSSFVLEVVGYRRSVASSRRVAEGSAFCMSTINRLGWRTDLAGCFMEMSAMHKVSTTVMMGLVLLLAGCTSSTAPASREQRSSAAAAVQAEAAAKGRGSRGQKAEAAAQAAHGRLGGVVATYCSASQLAVELGPLTPRWPHRSKSSLQNVSAATCTLKDIRAWRCSTLPDAPSQLR